MVINGVKMDKACEEQFEKYIQEIEVKNKCKIPDAEKKQAKNIFAAGYSACLEVVLSTQKK